jgi:hypothetical protein
VAMIPSGLTLLNIRNKCSCYTKGDITPQVHDSLINIFFTVFIILI